jgi:hypothetical protein
MFTSVRPLAVGLIAGSALVVSVTPARGEGSIWDPCADRIATENWEVLSVMILATDSVQTAAAAPSHVTVRVERVFDGKTKPGLVVKALWAPRLDTEHPDYDHADQVRWEADTVVPPVVGTGLIVLAYADTAGLRFFSTCRYPDTAGQRSRLGTLIRKQRKRRAAEIAEWAAEAETKRARERARVARARQVLPSLCARSQSIWVGTPRTLALQAEGSFVSIEVARVLKGSATEVTRLGYTELPLVYFPETEATQDIVYRYHNESVILFVRLQPQNGPVAVWRVVDPRFGILPTTPQLVSDIQRAAATRQD